jgi:hypothetical protein
VKPATPGMNMRLRPSQSPRQCQQFAVRRLSANAATVHDLIRAADLRAASAINDAASRVGGVIAIAIVPALIGASGGRGLAHGYQPAMIAMGGLASPQHSSPGRSSPMTVSLACTPRCIGTDVMPYPSRIRRAHRDRSPAPSTGGITATATTAVSTQREGELLGQTVVVIGGSAGIGLETARRARAERASVILTGRNPERRATLPIRRVVGPADVAALAVHIMSNTALTGATYDIDGGQQLVS